jgi:hypothetical protein
MDILTHCTLRKLASWSLVVALLLVLSLAAVPAWSQANREIAAVVVLPVVDDTGAHDALLSARATDALALALENSGVYRVIALPDLKRELKTLGLTAPLSESEQVRVGTALQAERVISARLKSCSVNGRTGEVRAELDLRSLVVDIGTVMNGSSVEVITKPVPGFGGDDIVVVNEAMREVTERAVTEMEKTRRRHGSVILVDDVANVSTDLGVDDGILVGDKLVVMRGFYLPDQEKTVMRNVGTIQVKSAQVQGSTARSLEGLLPRIGDRVYPVYSSPEAARRIARGKGTTQTLQILAGLGVILGVVAVATGPQNISAVGVNAVLHQDGPGQTPVVRVYVNRPAVPDPEHTHFWLLFRGPSAGFPAIVDTRNYLVAIQKAGSLAFMEDDSTTTYGLTLTNGEFTFVDTEGTEGTGTVTATYNHFGLVSGNTYFYKVERVVDPYRPQIPTTNQIINPVTPTFTVNPDDAISNPSEAAGPVTMFQPSAQTSPVGTGTPVSPTGAVFTWTPQVGADQYQVQVYDSPTLSHLVVSSPVITWTGQTSLSWTFSDFTFAGDTTYYWVVGSRASGEGYPEGVTSARTVPFILSTKASFKTVYMPPPPTTSSAGSRRPSHVPGGWHEHRASF